MNVVGILIKFHMKSDPDTPALLLTALHLPFYPGSMKMSSSDSYFYAAIVAVLAVHVVLALFVYVAWNEGTPKEKGKHD